jgi:hypothetical protein
MRAMRAAVVLLACCAVVSAQEVRRAVPVVAEGTVLNDRAKFIAGIPLPETSPLAKFQSRGAYREHSKAYEKLWMRYAEYYYWPMRQWTALEVSPRIQPGLPVFYFFGGPDSLAVRALFPDASDYILGGLEPVGGVPPPESLDPAKLEAALANLRKSTEVILSFGHFITKDMKAELELTDLRGVVPVMMAFIVMSGGEVLELSYFGIGADGREGDFGKSERAGTKAMPGVVITFRPDAQGAPRRLRYVQADVSNDGLGKNGGLLKWAARFGEGNAYLKAASYLMHEGNFSGIREFILGNSRAVLQDDSGIPLKYFRNENWRLWFFGTYSGTLDIFKKYYQPDMGEAFKAAGAALPFGTGYKWKRGESNLLLAVKQEARRAEPVEPRAVVEPTPPQPVNPGAAVVEPIGPEPENTEAVVVEPRRGEPFSVPIP